MRRRGFAAYAAIAALALGGAGRGARGALGQVPEEVGRDERAAHQVSRGWLGSPRCWQGPLTIRPYPTPEAKFFRENAENCGFYDRLS